MSLNRQNLPSGIAQVAGVVGLVAAMATPRVVYGQAQADTTAATATDSVPVVVPLPPRPGSAGPSNNTMVINVAPGQTRKIQLGPGQTLEVRVDAASGSKPLPPAAQAQLQAALQSAMSQLGKIQLTPGQVQFMVQGGTGAPAQAPQIRTEETTPADGAKPNAPSDSTKTPSR